MVDSVNRAHLTQTEYAKWRKDKGLPGGTKSAVAKAVAEGRISTYGERKLIDPVQADAQWARNTRPRVTSGSQPGDAGAQLAALVAGDVAQHMPGSIPRMPAPGGADAGFSGAPDSAEYQGDLMHHKCRLTAAQAGIAERELAEKNRTLTSTVLARQANMSAWRFLRDMLQSFGRQVTPKIAHLTDKHEIQLIIDADMRSLIKTFGSRTMPELLLTLGNGLPLPPGLLDEDGRATITTTGPHAAG